MYRTRNWIAALVSVGLLTGTPALAQHRGKHGYSVAENAARHGDSRVTIPAGTAIPATLDEEIPVDRDRLGDPFDAHVKRDVVVEEKVAIPAGAPAKVTLVESSETPRPQDR